MTSVWESLASTFGPQNLAALFSTWVPRTIVAVVVLLVFALLWRLVLAALAPTLRRAKLDETLQRFIVTAVRATMFVVAVITALGQLGIDVTSLVASLGVAGLTIGFAARDAMSNLISGLFIFWDRPFVIGDLIEIGDKYGRVEDITMRSTRVVTPDGKMLAIPNSVVINSTVSSYTNFPRLRLDVEVTVAVTENLGQVRRILLDMLAADARFLAEPEPSVVVKLLNDYNVLLEVRAWIQDERQHIALRFALREMIFDTLNGAGVQMPYETIQLAPFEVSTPGRSAAT